MVVAVVVVEVAMGMTATAKVIPPSNSNQSLGDGQPEITKRLKHTPFKLLSFFQITFPLFQISLVEGVRSVQLLVVSSCTCVTFVLG